MQGTAGCTCGEEKVGESICCWLQLLILPDVRPENFMAQKYCVTIPVQPFLWRRFSQVSGEVPLPLLYHWAQSVLTMF